TQVDFHFDVMCPWCYQTSKWIREVTAQRDVAVRWRFFSLEEINREEGKKHPWEREWSYGWSLLRIAALLRRRPDGNDAVDRFYALAGKALHEDARKVHTPDGAKEVLAEMGLDAGATLDEALADPTTHDDVRADHDRVVDLGGFGVPTLVLDGADTIFGPVITPAPTGPAASRLWDLMAGWAEFPHLYEVRRPKTPQDWKHIDASFAPCFEARDWRSIQNPVA
ncbi:MAG: DsbA family oxidoreductase, partial [Acidimicrobiales bacterium]